MRRKMFYAIVFICAFLLFRIILNFGENPKTETVNKEVLSEVLPKAKADYINDFLLIKNKGIRTGYPKDMDEKMRLYSQKTGVPYNPPHNWGPPMTIVFGTIVNTGEKTIRSIVLNFCYLDVAGKVLYRAEYRNSKLEGGMDRTVLKQALKAGFAQDYESILIPEEYLDDSVKGKWSGEVKVEIVNVEFAD